MSVVFSCVVVVRFRASLASFLRLSQGEMLSQGARLLCKSALWTFSYFANLEFSRRSFGNCGEAEG
jgi:hypothetical protein